MAPRFKLRSLEGKHVVLDEVLKTGPVLVVFWATCCSGTHALMMHLDLLQERYSESGFTVLAISVDDNKTAARVRPWVLARRLTYPVLLDPTGDVMRLCHVTAIPHVLLVDQQRCIVASHAGFLPGDEQTYEREIRELLGIMSVNDEETR
jgi:cytochrome c biogenesis protein CcmG, thiol:disulfide interchange protein DsbE